MAASNINSVVITGNLTRDPSCVTPAAGPPSAGCASPSTAAARMADGEWIDKPNYFDVTVWGAQGENCANYLSKGRPVAVEGRLDWREWEAKDGRQAPAGRDHRQQRPVPRLPRRLRGGGGGNGFTPAVRRPRRHL